jgi:hypothetical protein
MFYLLMVCCCVMLMSLPLPGYASEDMALPEADIWDMLKRIMGTVIFCEPSGLFGQEWNTDHAIHDPDGDYDHFNVQKGQHHWI